MIQSIVKLIIISGGFLYLISASLYLAEKNKTAAHYIIMAYLFCVSIWQLYYGLTLSKIILSYPHLAYVHIPFYFFTAPLLYFFFRILIRSNFQFKLITLIHFVPGVVAFFCLLPFYLDTADKKLEFLLSFRVTGNMSNLSTVYSTLILLAVISMSIYAFVFIFKCMPLFAGKKIIIEKITFISLIIIVLNYLIIIIYIITFILRRYFALDSYYFDFIFQIISVAMSAQIYLFLVMKTRYPDFVTKINEEAERIRYVNSRIAGLDVDKVVSELINLMEMEKAFCDEDMTLASLAEELSITPYQLSQILNERLSKNFNSFINEYRIKEAERYLIDEPERSIISISYAVGFNTTATFYKSFAKIHKESPIKFRESRKK